MLKVLPSVVAAFLLALAIGCSSDGDGTPVDASLDRPDSSADAVPDSDAYVANDNVGADTDVAIADDTTEGDGDSTGLDTTSDTPAPPLDLSIRLLPGEVAAGRLAKQRGRATAC